MHPIRRTRIYPKGRQSPLEGLAPSRNTGANKGSICRYNMLDLLLKASPLRAQERGPFTRVRGIEILRTSPVEHSRKFAHMKVSEVRPPHMLGSVDETPTY
jgi:hypothetical protein